MSRGRLASGYRVQVPTLSLCRKCQPCKQRAAAWKPQCRYALNDEHTLRFGKRCFHRSHSHSHSIPSHSVESSVTAADNGAPYTFPIRRTYVGNTLKDIENTSSIRASLKEWSVQNARAKTSDASEELPTTGRILHIPGAIFVGREALRSNDKDFDDPDIDQNHPSSDVETSAADAIVVQPGTLITYTSPAVSGNQFAVYMGNVGEQQLLALADGSWTLDAQRVQSMRMTTPKSFFSVPNFLDQTEMDHLKQFMPKKSIKRPTLSADIHADVSMKGSMPAHAIRHFTAKVRNFQDEVDMFRRQYSHLAEASYEKLAHPHQYRLISFSEYVESGLSLNHDELSEAAKMAIVSVAVGVNSITFLPAGRSISALIMPKDLSDRLAKVTRWIRQYQDAAAQAAVGVSVASMLNDNPLAAFISKARRLILTSRKIRAPTTTGALGPSSARPAAKYEDGLHGLRKVTNQDIFAEEDLMIIDFLWTASFLRPAPDLLGHYKLGPLSALVLRAVGAYPNLVLNGSSVRLFLKELGCVDPWISPFHMWMNPPIPGGRASSAIDELVDEYAKFEKSVLEPLDSKKLMNMDSMAELRKDWGDLPAFAIDTFRGVVAEDAVSIESAEELAEGHWIHVHSTHLTAHFGPETIVARYARKIGTSVFNIDKSKSTRLLPKSLAKLFHLQAGSPVITVSTLVGNDGAVHDIKVTPGTLKHVVRLTKNAYYHLLGSLGEQVQHFSTLRIGQKPESSSETVTDEIVAYLSRYKRQLLQLNQVLNSRARNRVENWSNSISEVGHTFELDTQVDDTPPLHNDREHESVFWKGDPTITMRARHVLPMRDAVSRSDDPNALAMRLAAESAGRWLTQRNIPAIFLGSLPLKQAYPTGDDHGSSLNSRAIQSRSTRALPLVKHNSAEYACWTSPLRRYIDMVVHYQTDSYLRAEAEGLISPNAPLKDDGLLAFTEANLQEYLDRDAINIDKFAEIRKQVSNYYSLLGLFRAFHFREAPLPHEWEVLVDRPLRYDALGVQRPATGSLVPFGLPCLLLPSKEAFEMLAAPRTFIRVKINRIDPERQVIECTAVAPPTKEQTLRDPIRTSTEHRPEEISQAPEGIEIGVSMSRVALDSE